VLTVDYARLGLRPGERILDLGCGGGRHAFESYRRGGRVVAVDADAGEVAGAFAMLAMMAEAGERGRGGAAAAAQGDALVLPFRDGSFDRVIAAEVLEHIADDGAAMADLARVLRPGGILAVTVPRFGPEVVNWALSDDYHVRPGGHVRIYRRSQLVARLEAAGLRPLGGHHAHGLHAPYWWLRCLVGVDRADHPLVRAYHQVLVWDIVKRPRVLRAASRVLDPMMGKSLVLYFEKPAAPAIMPAPPMARRAREATAA
jgi:SAM-dependent methyltransferase